MADPTHPFQGDPWGPCSQCAHPIAHPFHDDIDLSGIRLKAHGRSRMGHRSRAMIERLLWWIACRRQQWCAHEWVEVRGKSGAFSGGLLHVECSKCGVWTDPWDPGADE